MNAPTDRLMAAEFCARHGICPTIIAAWRRRGIGPAMTREGQNCFITAQAESDWLNSEHAKKHFARSQFSKMPDAAPRIAEFVRQYGELCNELPTLRLLSRRFGVRQGWLVQHYTLIFGSANGNAA